MQDDEPYRAPRATIDPTTDADRLPIMPASRWRRLFNLLIDAAVVFLLSVVLVVAYVLVALEYGDEGVLDSLDRPSLLRDYGVGVLVMALYYIPMERLCGFTLGKLATGTRVVDASGGRPSWGQVVGRTFARMIPLEAFSLLLSDDSERRGWHDTLPRTWVVRVRGQ